ncbi:4-hydroxy-tetrahydrodipicolinate synthase [Enterococcus cecorum]|nr:4-hydroxy-tetrahydrodipicolinate synthase [Enterococcus cecorum]
MKGFEDTMKQIELNGIIVPILTPMNEDESINLEELRAQVERMIENGIHGIFPFGTNGEGYILTGEEKKLVLETVIDQVNGRVPVYAGTGCISTKKPLNKVKWPKLPVRMYYQLLRQVLQLRAKMNYIHIMKQ